MKEKVRNFFLDLLFPKFCFGCQKEGCYLCQDCQALLEISGFHRNFSSKHLNDLYFATDYKNPLLKKLIQNFKYQPFVKSLSLPLADLIIGHFQLLDNPPQFLTNKENYLLIPLPLEKKRLKWRGFNQTEEIAKNLSSFLNIDFNAKALVKIKKTLPQVKLSETQRKENISQAFYCQNKNKIKGKNILLVDDIYTTGATMEEAARILKNSGAREITGIAIARAQITDYPVKS